MGHDAPVPNHSTAHTTQIEAQSAAQTDPSRPLQPTSRRPRRRGPRWFVWLIGCMLGVLLLALLACALVGGLVVGIALKLANEVTATTTTTQSFAVNAFPSLTIHNASGRLDVQPGPAGVINAQITKTARDTSQSAARAALDGITVNTTQMGDQIAISTDFRAGSVFASSSSVNLLLTVPPNTTIAADITAGDIQISGIGGLVEVTGGAGDITLQDVALADGSHIHMTTGSVTMRGAVMANASVDLSVSTGDVDLQLPADTATQLDAHTSLGAIHISGWPMQTTRVNSLGEDAEGPLGAQPTCAIHIRVDSGDITVSQM
jgi:Putative adhesin